MSLAHLPMSDALRAQKDRIIKVHVGGSTVAQGFSSVEDERDLDSNLFLTRDKFVERYEVVRQRLQRIFMANKIEPCTRK